MTELGQSEGLPVVGKWDHLLTKLQELRASAGEPSYASIAETITKARLQAGMNEHAARVPRSTVHAAFRLGRSRINLALTREIVEALGGGKTLVDDWINGSTPEPEPIPHASTPEPTLQQAWILALACLLLNLFGRVVVDFFNLPLHFDMIGTAIAAIALGPWIGAGVGLSTNVLGVLTSGWVSLPFAVVNIIGALVWGYGVRKWGMGRTLPRFFVLNLTTALACSLAAIPIIVAFLEPNLRVGDDVITQLVSESIDTFVIAASFSNIMVSVWDKLLSGFVALVVIASLPFKPLSGGYLVMTDGRQ